MYDSAFVLATLANSRDLLANQARRDLGEHLTEHGREPQRTHTLKNAAGDLVDERVGDYRLLRAAHETDRARAWFSEFHREERAESIRDRVAGRGGVRLVSRGA
jgi:hypothetical protein